jgi:Putative  PD-(D/E)XK family member, (DUF4420)
MTKINEIWNELENDASSSTGLLLRRYSPTVLTDVYIALRKTEKLRCIALKLKNNNTINLSQYANLKDIKAELIPDEKDSSKTFLLILLTNKQHEDIFATLCEDLITGIATISDEKIVVKELLNRLEKWKSLFDKASAEGLSAEEQRGLYGELYFLKKWIVNSTEFSNCIQAWLGPEKAIRDYQLSDWALEVKTTHGNNHQKIQISSERQLDTVTLKTLILLHLSLEVQQKNGDTLNKIVKEIIELLNADIVSQTRFKSKLLQAGYFNHHKALYENIGYQIRQKNYYLVNNDFPRIEEKDIRKGVGDVKYSIILSEYTDYIITESSVLNMIN